MIGTQIGQYQITERIGGGGFATVFRAQNTQTGRTVALKVLREQYAEDAEFIQRFRQEFRTIRSLPDNPHIVKPLEYGEVGPAHYLAMEFLEGEDLDQVLVQRGGLPVDQAVDIASQMAEALAVAHSRQVVHRDVKPQNVKLMSDGTVKVLDFGIARATEAARLTRSGAFVGTPPYMAPEIWEGQPASQRSDVYSLGVVLYEMIAGQPPFQADTPAAVMRQHLFEQPRPLNRVRVDTPPRIARIVTRCLAKSPADRYASATELLAALQGGAEVKTPPPAAYRARPPRPTRHHAPLSLQVRRRMEPAVRRATSLLSRLPQMARGQPRAYLEGRSGRMAGYRFKLSRRDTILGGAPHCAIRLDDRYLSPFHARIYFADGRYILYDLDSLNGTYLNGCRVGQPYVLDHGDRIQIGECLFTFSAPPVRQAAGVYRGTRSTVADQLMAAAAGHASVMLIPLVVPALIWALYRDRSPYVSYQAKQALLYQGLYVAILFLRGVSLLRFLSPALLWLLASAGGCYAAYCCYRGRAFAYPILGELAARF